MQTSTMSPILWPEEFRREELRGSPVLNEARDREVQIREEWASIMDSLQPEQLAGLDNSWFNEQAFLEAFAVIVAHAVYLPSAQCFALLPYISLMGKTGNDNGCEADYDEGALPPRHERCDWHVKLVVLAAACGTPNIGSQLQQQNAVAV